MVELFCKSNLLVVGLDGLFFIWKTVMVVREFAWTDSALVVFDCNALSQFRITVCLTEKLISDFQMDKFP